MGALSISKALSNKSRQNILRLLLDGPAGVSEVAEKLGLKPTAVRHHLQSLLQIGLVEGYEKARGTVGRPEVYYKLTEKHVDVNFPRRNYLFLSDTIIEGLEAFLGKEETMEIFAKIGRNLGETIVKDLMVKHDVERWTPQMFQTLFVEGLLEEFETAPEVVVVREREVVYRERNCIFMEAALKHRETVCDGLDAGFFSGVIRSMGQGVNGTRLKCKGHGDPCCEYSVKWSMIKKKAGKASR